jgi:outer membrane protein
LSVSQTLFSSGKIEAAVKAAERGVIAERSNLANTEMQILVDAATAYMSVLRDTSVVDLRKNNITVLKEQLRQTQDRFSVGEVTRTDVAQVEARLASAQADLATAEGTLKSSIAKYRQVIGEDPRVVDPARPLARISYKSLNDAVAIALAGHPSVMATQVNIEVAEYLLRQAYAGLGPTVGLVATSSRRADYTVAHQGYSSNTLVAQLTMPLYDGGDTHGGIRQAKEVVGQRRLEADAAREKVRAGVIASWSQLEAAKARIQSANAQVEAATIALNGIREEAKVGQRTTLDVLLTDQDLLSARVSLVQAQYDRVVFSYSLAQAVGQLNAENLKLNVRIYDPAVHYNAVSDKWFGIIPPENN